MALPNLTVYYDGLCPLCSREIEHYRRRARPGTVAFVDITDPAFDPPAHGLDAAAVHRTMHVRVGSQIRTGVDAFLAIWEVVPGFRWLREVVSLPGVRTLARVLYWVFAQARPYLPRRKASCETGSCSRTH